MSAFYYNGMWFDNETGALVSSPVGQPVTDDAGSLIGWYGTPSQNGLTAPIIGERGGLVNSAMSAPAQVHVPTPDPSAEVMNPLDAMSKIPAPVTLPGGKTIFSGEQWGDFQGGDWGFQGATSRDLVSAYLNKVSEDFGQTLDWDNYLLKAYDAYSGRYDTSTNPMDIVAGALRAASADHGDLDRYMPQEDMIAKGAEWTDARHGAYNGKLFDLGDIGEGLMELISSGGFKVISLLAAPLIQSLAAGGEALGSGISASVNPSTSLSAPIGITDAGLGFSFENLGASLTGQGLIIPAGSTALIEGLSNALPTTAPIGESGAALGADAFAPMADSVAYAPADLSLTGDYDFGGEGLKVKVNPDPSLDAPIGVPSAPNLTPMGGGQGLQLPSSPNLESMGGGQGLTGHNPFTGETISEVGVTTPETMLESIFPVTPAEPSFFDQVQTEYEDAPDWVKPDGDLFDVLTTALTPFSDTPSAPEYVPETALFDDHDPLNDAIFRSAKGYRGVPGSGFTTFNIGAPGLFIP